MSKKPGKPKKSTPPEPLRAATEKKLAHAPKPRQLPAKKLLHEFQVYQIELEMQNEQLRQAQAALEESRDGYKDLYEFAPVGYLTLTATGQIREANVTCSRLFKAERNMLLRRRFSSFIAPEHRERWKDLFTGVLQHSEVSECEMLLKRGEGEHFYAQMNCVCLAKEGLTPVVRVTLTDVSQLRQAEEAMREWQQFIECAHWGMTIGRVEDRAIKLANPAFARMHGYTMEELHGIKVDKLYAPESRANLEQYTEILRSAGCYTFECVRLRKDGSTFPAMVDVSTVIGADGGAIFVANVTDISERKRIEHQLHNLSKHLLDIREEEKANIAREIHDDLGGTLTALKMEAYWLADELSAHHEASPLLEHVQRMAQLTDNATNATRRIITGLRPTILDDLGMLAALEWQCAEFQKLTGIECQVNHTCNVCNHMSNCEEKLGKLHSITLFRILQESLTNVSRHSRASRVEVEYHHSNAEAMLSIRDNGRGMTEKHTEAPLSYGILGMTERVKQLGGRIRFDNLPGAGFSVTVILPLCADNTAKEKP